MQRLDCGESRDENSEKVDRRKDISSLYQEGIK